jgi:hypothetical protein
MTTTGKARDEICSARPGGDEADACLAGQPADPLGNELGVLFMPAYNRLYGRIVQRVINTIDLRAGYTEIMGHPSAQVPHDQFRAADGLVFGSRRSGAYCAPPLSTGHGMRDPPVAGRCLAN